MDAEYIDEVLALLTRSAEHYRRNGELMNAATTLGIAYLIERLVKALRPFAEAADSMETEADDVLGAVRLADLRAARRALQEPKGQPKETKP